MSFEDEKLVDCLKANPCLWDKNRQDFRLSAMKDAKWKEIAGQLETTRECDHFVNDILHNNICFVIYLKC